MTVPHPARLSEHELLEECDVRRQRRSGPGGQHRNKVETGIFIEHRPTSIRAEATEKRSQQQNLELATNRLRINLALEFRSDDASDFPTELWNSRVRGGKISVSVSHTDFASLLCEAIDVLHNNNWDTKPSAEQLDCSTSQLVKFLKKEPRAFALLNKQREKLGLGRLK